MRAGPTAGQAHKSVAGLVFGLSLRRADHRKYLLNVGYIAGWFRLLGRWSVRRLGGGTPLAHRRSSHCAIHYPRGPSPENHPPLSFPSPPPHRLRRPPRRSAVRFVAPPPSGSSFRCRSAFASLPHSFSPSSSLTQSPRLPLPSPITSRPLLFHPMCWSSPWVKQGEAKGERHG